jgi:hypothetical protein
MVAAKPCHIVGSAPAVTASLVVLFSNIYVGGGGGWGSRLKSPTTDGGKGISSGVVTPRNRYPEDPSESAGIRAISIRRRPPTRRARQIDVFVFLK